ncbi:hypothetical protein LY76DRAFT_683445 [Colletotrichum caudatum]|nr:hypothetical protein LY76DRAFT_683445 [Colletotrichum caudatum]
MPDNTAPRSEKNAGDSASASTSASVRPGVDAEAAHRHVIDPAARGQTGPQAGPAGAPDGLFLMWLGSVSSWRNIFLVEGIITVGVGVSSLHLFPADPSETRIFNDGERALAMARIFHDQTGDPVDVLVGAWIYTCDQITVQGLASTNIPSWTLANAAPDRVRNVANGAVSGVANIGIGHRHPELHQHRREDRLSYW